MQCLLEIVQGMESVLALKRGGRAKHIMFRDDKDGVESGAKRSLKARPSLTARRRVDRDVSAGFYTSLSAGSAPEHTHCANTT